MPSIPASQLVTVNPSVIGVGGSAFDIVGLLLTNGTRVPIGSVQSIPDPISGAAFFGATAPETTWLQQYFQGYDSSIKKPAQLLVAQCNQSAVQAFERGASLAALTLTQLQAISGSLQIVIDGVLKSANLNLSAVTSFSNAASIIGQSLGITGLQQAQFTGSISTGTLTVSAISSGTIQPGQVLSGTGVTANTFIVAQLSGTSGGTGTYSVSTSQTALSQPITAFQPGVSFDPVSQAFVIVSGTTGPTSTIAFGSGAAASPLGLTQLNGAVISQGAAAVTSSTFAAFMNALVTQNNGWSIFTTLFDPDAGVGNTYKQAIAAWKNTQNNRYAYVAWDLDQSPCTTLPASSSLGQVLAGNNDSGTCLLDGDAVLGGWTTAKATQLAAFVCGAAASISFQSTNGRITFAYKSQAGISGSVLDPVTAANLGGNPQASSGRGNGYNFYGVYAQATSLFVFFQRGFVTGAFLWLDSFIDQIWLNNQMQNALVNFLAQTPSVPFNTQGAALIEAALATPIQAGLNFGAFAPGTISAAEIAAVNNQAGAIVSTTLQTQGYYLQVKQQPSTVRANRGPWLITFWYLDRGSVQSITLNSVATQ